MIEGAIFDLDGTLLDTMGMWMNVIFDYLRAVDRVPKPGLMDTLSTMSLAQAAEFCRQEYALPFSVEQIVADILKQIEHFYTYEAQPMPHVQEFLQKLAAQGVRMCVATASDHSLIERTLRRCGMAHYFSQILDCIEVGHGKDEPIIYRRSLTHLGTPKEKTVIFEDATHAIETAKKDGFPVAAVYSPYEKDPDRIRTLADVWIDNYSETEPFWRFAQAL
ncbi:MAG: HAD family hydrolase [Acutalibacteraceae bacterium]